MPSDNTAAKKRRDDMVSPTVGMDSRNQTSEALSGYTSPEEFSKGVLKDNYARGVSFVPMRRSEDA
jgi:hypothetical protein